MPVHKNFTGDPEKLAQALADWDKPAPAPTPAQQAEAFAGSGSKNMKPGARKFPGYAHFPGSGPAGYVCRDCRFIEQGKIARCGKFRVLTGRQGSEISAWSASCKYFQVGG